METVLYGFKLILGIFLGLVAINGVLSFLGSLRAKDQEDP
jgi:hypothetical protein